MNGKLWVAGAVLAIVLANTGCVSCCSKSYGKAWNCAPDCELPTHCRGNVYVFMVHGATPSTDCGLEALRAKLAECGFPKVGVGELAAAPCVWWEIKKIAKCEPDARFVLLGYDLGAPAAVCVARDLASKNIPVEAVVLLDPVGCGETRDLRTIVVASGSASYSTLPCMPRMTVYEANHFQLPAHPKTVAVVCGLLQEIAARDCKPGEDEIQEWNYPHAPEIHPLPMPRGDDWDILADTGTPLPINTRATGTTPPVATPTATPATPQARTAAPIRPVTFAGAVALPK
jgi:hypothetical protein